ncbi:serine/threonine-protein kinase [Streptomyces lanatus]|uniref:non-specific serine/threonine protein kinase n=1 Tax=Streptomyces lanatus TaxID=66900 RepID=A0ABV1XSU3_9ACTN|nr:serine/threonine-protein kinase [Streptomyces lanatus]
MLIAGRYRLSESIGRGGMGEVWRAYDETLGRHVAVKLLLPQDTDPTATSRFRLEAQTAARIDHPNVVGVRDFGEHDNQLYLVMELVEGDSLARLLAHSGAQPAERVALMAAHAAAGLAAAHRQGIVHRDIKPGNLMLDADGTLKIGDFGIARFMDDPGAALTATGQIVGTSLYLAPERALGRPAGPPSDVYSLGCVLYQLLTGRPPFNADTAVAILHQHLDAAPVPPRELGVAGLPPAFESYLLSLLAKEPEDRPAAQQAADWFAGGAWRGRPQPLPEASAPAAPAGRRSRVGETSNPTTYMLPSAQASPPGRGAPGRAHSRSRPRARSGTRRALITVAAAALFIAAMLLGMLWFSPDTTTAEHPKTDAPPSPTTSASPLDSSPSPLTTPTLATETETTAGREERREEEKRAQKQREQERQRAAQQGDDGDDDDGGEDD